VPGLLSGAAMSILVVVVVVVVVVCDPGGSEPTQEGPILVK